MRAEIYYHILEIGFTYEKGRKTGERWHLGEKALLLAECRLWRNLIRYAALEENGVDCSGEAFAELAAVAGRYRLENYERVIKLRPELEASTNRHEGKEAEKKILVNGMLELIAAIERSTESKDGKSDAYKALRQLHNIPRALHGADELGPCVSITFAEAAEYAGSEAMLRAEGSAGFRPDDGKEK